MSDNPSADSEAKAPEIEEDDQTENQSNHQEIQFDELPREEKVGAIFEHSGEALHHLKTQWEEERVQVYFLFYSFAMVGLMFYILYQNWTRILIGAFAFYVITVLPLLYIYEEEKYFESSKIPKSDDQ